MRPELRETRQSFTSDPASVRRARRFVTETMRSERATVETCNAFALISSELMTNFVEHGDGAALDVTVTSTPTSWELSIVGASTVTANNPVLHPDTWAISPTNCSTGRGLGIVRSLCDDITVTPTANGIRIQCRQRR